MGGNPDELTIEKLLATKSKFDQLVRSVKAADALDGVCICETCFGDRAMLAWPGYGPRRRCLAESNRLTDLGGTIRRGNVVP